MPVLWSKAIGSFWFRRPWGRASSDIDFLVEFENLGPEYMADRYFGFIEDATRRFGRPVQVLTPRMVRNPFFKRSLERDLTILHG